jgi:hypothetical protein
MEKGMGSAFGVKKEKEEDEEEMVEHILVGSK